jgi:2-phosphosulfolactate phosphatase
MVDSFSQAAHGVRFEWGPVGADRMAAQVSCLVVVDVLSFTTSVTVAVESGAQVFPYSWHDEGAAAFAEQVSAHVAVGRREVTETSPWSLSPAALRRAPAASRLVLPSPNGSAITVGAAGRGAAVAAGSLRNAAAMGEWLAGQGLGSAQAPVGVIASGERWPDGSLRPALEDLLGAGAVISALREATGGSALSPEAAAAAAAFTAVPDIRTAVRDSSSGRELSEAGFGEDVSIACETGACGVVPVLTNGAFTAAS